MPTVLRNNQHELLLYDESMSLLFGTEDTKYLTLSYPSISSTDTSDGDVLRIREDGVFFGEDYLGAKTMTFELGVITDQDADPHLAGADALNLIEGIWTHESFRDRSSAYGIMRSRISTRTVRCYGRPRRYAETSGPATNRGYTPVIADFTVMDGRWYDDQEQTVPVSLVPPSDGGMIAPFVFPLTSTPESNGSSSLIIGGTKTTWPVCVFHGPVSNPQVKIGNTVVGLKGDVPYGMTTTVDPRPWSRSVTRSDGANQSALLSYETPPLRRLLLSPGTYPLAYSGIDATNTSWVEVRWRDARARP